MVGPKTSRMMNQPKPAEDEEEMNKDPPQTSKTDEERNPLKQHDDDNGHEPGIVTQTRSRSGTVNSINLETMKDPKMHQNDHDTLRLMKFPTMIFFPLFQLCL